MAVEQIAQAGVAYQTALGWTLPISLALAAFGSAMALGKAVSSALDGMSRQPEAAAKIQTAMIIGCALIEALTIYALVAVILFWVKVF